VHTIYTDERVIIAFH